MSPDSGVYSQEALLDESAWLEGFARSLVADPSEAEDLSQDTLLTALQSQPEQRSGLRPWLARVLRNNAHRRAKRGRQRREREAQVYREEAHSAAELLERSETRRNVIHAVRSLPEPYKTAVMLRYWEELPPREIGARLGIHRETARTRIKRGLAMLRRYSLLLLACGSVLLTALEPASPETLPPEPGDLLLLLRDAATWAPVVGSWRWVAALLRALLNWRPRPGP